MAHISAEIANFNLDVTTEVTSSLALTQVKNKLNTNSI